MRAAPIIAAAVMLASGCASLAQPEAPAVMIDTTDASRAELRDVVSRALQRSDITLADDALMRDSFLLIERAPARDAGGQRLSGRDVDKPEAFQLVTRSARCFLVHQRTGNRYELKRARCASQTD